MHRANTYILINLLCLLTTCMQTACAQKNTPINGYDFSPVTKKVQGWIDSGYYNGASLIVAKDDKIIYRNYFGNYTPETVAYIASAGKWLAAATIAAIVDKGKLSWDDK